MRLPTKQTVLTMALTVSSVLFTPAAFGQTAGVIGIKFGFSGGYATSDNLAPTDQAGVVAVTNWNNLLPTSPSGADVTWTIAQDSAGNALSGVTLTPAGIDDGWYSGGTDCADGRLLYDTWKLNNSNGQVDNGGKDYATFTLANLPGSLYDVYVYVNDNNGNYWGNIQANSELAVSPDIDSSGFNGAEADPCSLSTPLHTAAGYGNPANYVKLPAVATTAGGVISITVVEQGGEFGVSGIELVPSSDLILSQDILPNYAETVVGDQVVFSAAYNNSPAVNLQWQFVSGGVTNNILGATTGTLTLNNLQLTNSGSYQLKAVNQTNSSDVAWSSAAPLVVANPPAAVNNVIADYAGQDGGANFYPAWTVNTNIDLIYGFPADGSGNPGTATPGAGNFGLDSTSGDPTVLTDGIAGVPGALKTGMVTCGPGSQAGQSMIYYLATGSAANGFDLTNISVYGGWTDPGRNEQTYQVLYSTVSAPTVFVPLATVDYTPADPTGAPSDSRTTLIPAKGSLARNVSAVEINFDTGAPKNGYEGYSEITINGTPSSQIYPPPPALTQDINPLTAEDVVGSSLTITAAFTGATSYQWQKNGTNIPNATTSVLVLNPLQLFDTATNDGYWLVASNAGGTFTSHACAVKVDAVPSAIGNVITTFAVQSQDVFPFTPSWNTNVLSESLIYQQNPPSGGYGTGDFTGGGDQAGGLPVLTDGDYGYITNDGTHPAFAAGGPNAGQFVTYTLGTNAGGYDVTNIQIAGGWNDDGRNSQFYTVSYSTVSSPDTFAPLTAVSNSPSFSTPSVIRTTITPAAGALASNVYAITVDFTTPAGVPNGYSGYSEISVFGSASITAPPPASPKINGPVVSSGNLILTGTGGTPNSPYTWLMTTNLTPPIHWATNATGMLDGTGSFSNSVPLGPLPASFYRLQIP